MLLKGKSYNYKNNSLTLSICLRHVVCSSAGRLCVCEKIALKVMTLKQPTVMQPCITTAYILYTCGDMGLRSLNNKSDILLLHIHSLCFLEVYAYSTFAAMFPTTENSETDSWEKNFCPDIPRLKGSSVSWQDVKLAVPQKRKKLNKLSQGVIQITCLFRLLNLSCSFLE